MGGWENVPVSEWHAGLLQASGITPEVALAAGVYSIERAEDVPDAFRRYGARVMPSLAFPYGEVVQLRPDEPVVLDGKPCKYLWPSGTPLEIATRRAGSGPVMLVEGTKQALCAASWAPDDFEVWGMVGCRGWYVGGAPSAKLADVDGRDVYIVLDSDAATNLDVYTAGVKLAEALELEGAKTVLFVRLPGSNKAGLDDILGGRPENQRARYLDRLINNSKTKPADAKPKPSRKKRPDNGPAIPATSEREMVICNGDKLLIINNMTDQLVRRWNASRMFNHGGVLSLRTQQKMKPLDTKPFYDILAQTCVTVNRVGDDDDPTYVYAWPDAQCVGAVMSRVERFAPLDQLVCSPFVRPDGTVCATSGYDQATSTYLLLTEDVEGIEVPEHPTDQQIEHARSLLVDDLLEGFPFPDEASLANAVATLLTPFIRSTVSLSPLAVVDAKQAGTGKNLFADTLMLVHEGKRAVPLPFHPEDEERRKFLTTVFSEGKSIFIFDEAHKIQGVSLARALTSPVWCDRVLGGNTMAQYPNNVTWLSLGNQVTVLGDMARRSYRVRLSYEGESPEARPAEDFKHPELKQWIMENRAALVVACLTLCRAWWSRGKPAAPCDARMGSFESWQATVGGILHVAGVKGFLEGMAEWRSESDYERSDWGAHLAWLYRSFPSEFTTGEVARKLGEDKRAEPPHGMEDTSKPGYTRELGRAYARQAEKWIDGLRIVKLPGSKHGNVGRYRVEKAGEDRMKLGEVEPVPPTAPEPVPPTAPERTSPIAKHQVRETGGYLRLPPTLLEAVNSPGIGECDRCEGHRQAFGSAGILYACPDCHPGTMTS